MKFKSIEEIGFRYRSLFGIYTASGKLPVFESVREFKDFSLQTELDIKKATKELFALASKEDKLSYGDGAVWRKCERAIKESLADEHDFKKEEMMENATHCDEDVIGLKEERKIGGLEETGDYFKGLFVNEKIARDCLKLLVKNKMAVPENVSFLNDEGEVLEIGKEKE